jgi:tetratricopeptide (TPR) repeat protein
VQDWQSGASILHVGSFVRPESAATSALPTDRLDGWKAIAAYLNRDRTTVIRWARERELPVHRLPGGKTATVFALRHELDRWAGVPERAAVVAELPPPPVAQTVPLPANPPVHPRWLALVALAALVVAVPALTALRGAPPASEVAAPALPADAAVASRFLSARDLIAERRAAGLERAIALLGQVTREAPGYALGHASLAEALLLSREFGRRRDGDAFPRARIAASTAIRLDPQLAEGHRMLGFIAYWADHDFAQSDARFRRALALDPGDALSHFWYGNVLSDHGDHRAALRQLDEARLMLPGSVAIRTDLAWAQWAAGRDGVAIAALEGIAREHPDFAVVHDCLAVIALASGDHAGYVRHFDRFAALRQDGDLTAKAHALGAALRRGADATRAEILRQALADAGADPAQGRAWPALVASAAGDRAGLRAILADADRRNEQWGSAGMVLHIERAWRADREIRTLLDHRKPPRPVSIAFAKESPCC